MNDIAIRVENLSKLYYIGAKQDQPDNLREWLTGRFRRNKHDARDEALWALKDVSFKVKRGEVVGVIGRNGAGKSTLLKILSRITEPTGGRVEMDGRVGSLLEVGTGFHPELTGRENIFYSGAILGMRRAEIDRRFDEILDFSGVEKFIDTPFKRYSSGMKVRLGFAVAAHLEPEILLIDEVLAVGDATFQRKCLTKMNDISRENRTILFVSHNLAAIKNLCPSSILLEGGAIETEGDSNGVIASYMTLVSPAKDGWNDIPPDINRFGTGILRTDYFTLRNQRGESVDTIESGEDVLFCFGYTSNTTQTLKNVDAGFWVDNEYGETLFAQYSSYMGQKLRVSDVRGEFQCLITDLPLSPGRYLVHPRIHVFGELADGLLQPAGAFQVEFGDFYGTGSKGFFSDNPLVNFMVKGDWGVGNM